MLPNSDVPCEYKSRATLNCTIIKFLAKISSSKWNTHRAKEKIFIQFLLPGFVFHPIPRYCRIAASASVCALCSSLSWHRLRAYVVQVTFLLSLSQWMNLLPRASSFHVAVCRRHGPTHLSLLSVQLYCHKIRHSFIVFKCSTHELNTATGTQLCSLFFLLLHRCFRFFVAFIHFHFCGCYCLRSYFGGGRFWLFFFFHWKCDRI